MTEEGDLAAIGHTGQFLVLHREMHDRSRAH